MANETKYQIQQMTSSGLIDIHPVTKAEYVTTDDKHQFATKAQLANYDELAQEALVSIDDNSYVHTEDKMGSGNAGNSIAIIVDYSDKAGAATKDGSGNTIASTYATKTELANKISEISEIAEGKTKTYVVDYTATGMSSFNTSKDELVIQSLKTVDNLTINAKELKLGDVILIKQTDVPDRFVGSISLDKTQATLYKMETAKVDLSSYINEVTQDDFTTDGNGVIVSMYQENSELFFMKNDLTTKTATTASGTATTFVSNVTQAANGKITVTKTAMPTYNNYVLPTASSSTLGGIKTNYTANGKNYGVSVDSNGNAYVNVPWANTTYGVAKYNTLGLLKPAYTSTNAATLTTAAATNTATPTIAAKTTTAGRYYGVEADKNGYLFVNVPWVDTNTNTTYSAGSGLSLSGTQFNLSSSGITAGTYSVATYDEYGRATAGGQLIEVGTAGQTAPSASLVTGGLFFKKVN